MEEILLKAKLELETVNEHIKNTGDLNSALTSARKAMFMFSQIRQRKFITNSQRVSALLQSGRAKKGLIQDNESLKQAFSLNMEMLNELNKLLNKQE